MRDTEAPGGLPRWVWLGLALRLALVGFHHPWDLQTFYNMFADLSRGTWPYETFRTLSGVARALTSLTGVREPAYEYYAYPPLLALLYWPVARIVASLTPLPYAFTIPGALALRAYPWTFLVAFKLPLWLSDLAIALVLRRLAGERAARLFFLNPLLVVVSGSWTVDTLMVLPSLLSVALVLRGRYAWGGVLLAVGALVKWMPVVLWPAVALWLVYTGVEGRRQAAFHAAFWVTLGVGLLPGWPGVLEVARFHAERPGAHLTPHVLLYVLQTWRGRPDAELVRLSAAVGSVTLPAALLLAYVVQYRRRLPLVAACCLSLTAFYLGSKIVNEPYLFLWVPLLLWELSERPDARKEFVMRAGYGAALAFATVNVPIVLFAAPVVLAVLPESPYPEVVFRDASRALWPWREQALILAYNGVCPVSQPRTLRPHLPGQVETRALSLHAVGQHALKLNPTGLAAAEKPYVNHNARLQAPRNGRPVRGAQRVRWKRHRRVPPKALNVRSRINVPRAVILSMLRSTPLPVAGFADTPYRVSPRSPKPHTF